MINSFIIFLQVTIQLFSKHQIQEIKLHAPSKKVVMINSQSHFTPFFKLPKKTQITINKKHRKYISGHLSIHKKGKELKLFQTLDFNDYVLSVLRSELDEEIPTEALKAFYLVVKNYSLTHLKRHKTHDFCDIAHCQLYYGNSSKPQPPNSPKEAFKKKLLPHGELYEVLKPVFNQGLFYKEKPILAPYSSSCGPSTCDAQSIWHTDIPYLKKRKLHSFLDPWSYQIKKTKLHALLKVSKIANKKSLDCSSIPSTPTHTPEDLRRVINHQFGWNKIKSNLFTIKASKHFYHFKGYGFGHNVGFCIKEAIELAKQGLSYEEILKYFFTDIQIKKLNILP